MKNYLSRLWQIRYKFLWVLLFTVIFFSTIKVLVPRYYYHTTEFIFAVPLKDNRGSGATLRQSIGEGFFSRELISEGEISSDRRKVVFNTTSLGRLLELTIRGPEPRILLKSVSIDGSALSPDELKVDKCPGVQFDKQNQYWTVTNSGSMDKKIQLVLSASDYPLQILYGILAVASLIGAVVLEYVGFSQKIRLLILSTGKILFQVASSFRYALLFGGAVSVAVLIISLCLSLKPCQAEIEYYGPPPTLSVSAFTYHFDRGDNRPQYQFPSSENNFHIDTTRLFIRDFWLIIPKGGMTTIKRISFEGEALGPEELLTLSKNRQAGQIAEAGFILSEGTYRFDATCLNWNKTVQKCIVQCCVIAAISGITAAVLAGLGLAWCRKKRISISGSMSNKILCTFLWIVFFGCFTQMAYTRYIQCGTYILSVDSIINLGIVMQWIDSGRYEVSAFITSGMTYLAPVGIIIKLADSYEWTVISAAIVSVNLLFLLFPIIVILFSPPWRWSIKITVNIFILLIANSLGPIFVNLNYLSSLYGEVAGSCVFVGALVMIWYARNKPWLLLGGAALRLAVDIKSVFEIFVFAGIAAVIWIAFAGGVTKKLQPAFLKRLIWPVGGYLGCSLFLTGLKIGALGNWGKYLAFLNDVKNYNFESGLRIDYWSPQYLVENFTTNCAAFGNAVGSLGMAAFLAGCVFGIMRMLTLRKGGMHRTDLPTLLLIMTTAYFLFWLISSGWSWRIRNVQASWLIFLFSAAIWFGNYQMRKYSNLAIITLSLISSALIFFNGKNNLFIYPKDTTSQLFKVTQVLNKEATAGCTVFTPNLQQYGVYIRGSVQKSIGSENELKNRNVVVGARKGYLLIPPWLKKRDNRVIYEDDSNIIICYYAENQK